MVIVDSTIPGRQRNPHTNESNGCVLCSIPKAIVDPIITKDV